MIEASHLSKAFGKVQAVDDLSLHLEDGKITGLLGPNGSGKTTTMRMLYALVRPDRGSVQIDGIDVAQQPIAAKARLGVVPDSRGIYSRLTARENMLYYGRLQGVAEDTLNERIEKLVQQLAMEDIINRRTDGFSQGQRVKVAIARAMVGDPHNLLLDEPTNGLDVMSTRALRNFIAAQREAGKAVLLSTHIMQEVAALCDHIIIIAGGRVRAQGSAERLRDMADTDNIEDAFVRLIGTDEGLMS